MSERDYASELAEAFKESTPIGETAKLDVLHAELVARLDERSRPERGGEIELHAIYRKDGSLLICDQDARGFAGKDARMATLGEDPDAIVFIEVQMEAPDNWRRKPRAEVRLSVPLDVEERLPVWMQEYLAGRG